LSCISCEDAAGQKPSLRKGGGAVKKILIVDDENRMRRLYDYVLTQKGYKTYEAGNADDANEILKKEKIDVVLLDINMPGTGGNELYDVMKLFHRGVKVIVSSVLPVSKQQQLVQGATAYYDKSQAIEMLFTKIIKVCDDSPVK
jgi:DNA-binding NtrC family response regulator